MVVGRGVLGGWTVRLVHSVVQQFIDVLHHLNRRLVSVDNRKTKAGDCLDCGKNEDDGGVERDARLGGIQ